MWSRFLRAFFLTAAAALGGAVLFILLADPLGVSPIGVLHKKGYTLTDRRFNAPQIIANEKFDSFLVGTSTIHHVDPAWADQAFGGRFATVAIHGGTPYELTKMMQLIGRRSPHTRRAIIGLDARRWCKTESYDQYNPKALFPEALYDENPLNELRLLLNPKMLRAAQRQFLTALGRRKPVMPLNGYHNNLDEKKWTLAGARLKLYGKHPRGQEAAALGLDDAADSFRVSSGAPSFPDLTLLELAIGALPPEAEIIATIMPSHASVLRKQDRAGIETCKREIAAVIDRHHGYLLDFRINSDWTRNDENFWDENHFRVALARVLITRIKGGVELKRDADDGTYRVLAAPPASLRVSAKPRSW
jgi:hypothetical protein